MKTRSRLQLEEEFIIEREGSELILEDIKHIHYKNVKNLRQKAKELD